MQRYFARIVRALVISLLGFGGGIGLMVFIIALIFGGGQHAVQYGLQAGTIIGGIFAVMLVGVFLPLDVSAHLFLAKGHYNELWELEQTREFQFEGSLKELLSQCRNALLAVAYVKSVSEDTDNLSVKAAIGTSWRSGGEKMSVEIKPVEGNKWLLRCTSCSASTPVLFDYGKNFENVETWLREMSAPPGSQTQPA